MSRYRLHLKRVTYSYVDIDAETEGEAIYIWAIANPELETCFDYETDDELNNITRED